MKYWLGIATVFFLVCYASHSAFPQSLATSDRWVTVSGTVYDQSTNQPVPFATVRIVNSGRSATSNDQGQFRLVVPRGDTCNIKFSHVAYYSEQAASLVADSDVVQNIYLRPTMIVLNTIRVSSHDPGEEIILEAIKRKQEILHRLHDYRFDAYTKLVVRGKKKDTSRIFLITESQVSCFWEQPDKYKEIITSRRQTKNLPPDANLVAVGDILNFNKDRIDLGDEQVVSPTAHDALDHYHYYLLDTLLIDSARVFVLEVEPKSDIDPLFVGQIQIADSTFDVVGVDFGFNPGFHPPMLSKIRYTQRFAQYHDKYWMPVEIHLSANVKLPFPIPGIPSDLTLDHMASLHSYSFEQGTPKGTFGEIAAEVSPDADRVDSSAWLQAQTIPLTDEERYGYQRIDSIERAPKPLLGQIVKFGIAVPLLASTQERFFHFNRVEGAYLGLGATVRPDPKLSVGFRSGYAFGMKQGQYEGSASYLLSEPRALQVQAMYHRRVMHRPTIFIPNDWSMTLPALANGSDPYDYYLENGYQFGVSAKLVNHTRLAFMYDHYRQSTLVNHDDFTIFDPQDSLRSNPAVADGRLRTISLQFRFDSRPMYRLKRRDVFADAASFTQFSVTVERSSPTLLNSDFDFTNLNARLFRRQNTLGLGQTTLQLTGALASRGLPPQRYTSVPSCMLGGFMAAGMQTLDTRNFAGSNALALAMQHQFGTRLFRMSGLPLIKRLPWELSIHGGIFWTDFNHHTMRPGDNVVRLARTGYSEIGFGLGRLLPILSALHSNLYFTWQLSGYDTKRHAISWDIGF